jgi:PIN domain nuclease of toxin-antitoxin system
VKVLLDTQVLFWWYAEPEKLTKRARAALEDAEITVLVSAVVAWELAIKAAIGKIDALSLVLDLNAYLADAGFLELPVTVSQATRVALLPPHHRDPFDRLLIAQAQELQVQIVSSDPVLDRYDIRRLW